jgi:RimJ/RimL family protein N-acetyltransferase
MGRLFVIRLIDVSESSILQAIFDACSDYAVIHFGEPFSAEAAEKEFFDLPSGSQLHQKRVFIIEDNSGIPVGAIEGICGYPHETCWYLGLFLILPIHRNHHIGSDALKNLETFIKNSDLCSEIKLAVLLSNKKALRFWKRNGFSIISCSYSTASDMFLERRFVLNKQLI